LGLSIALDTLQWCTPKTFAISLIDEVGVALMLVASMQCFVANLAFEFVYFISLKD